MDKKCKWAVLGTSLISQRMIKAIQESSNAQLYCIGTGSLPSSAEKAKQIAKAYSIPKIHPNYQSVLEDPAVEVIYIGLANHMHKEWIIKAALAGKHILCEKPLVLNLGEAKEIAAILEQQSVFCMEALMYVCHPFTQQLKTFVQDKLQEIGGLAAIEALYYANFAHLQNPIAAGAIWNIGCYPLSLTRLIMEEEPVISEVKGLVDEADKDFLAQATLTFTNKIKANIHTSNNQESLSIFKIIGAHGQIEVKTNPWMPGQINSLLLHRNNQTTIEYTFTSPNKDLYSYQIELLSDCILQNSPILLEQKGVSWQHSLGNIKAIDDWRKQLALCIA